jgi:hypothetical protein
LRGTIEWSFQLLDQPERRLFARLSVFPGGATLAAVEAVCNPKGDLGIETFDGLASLFDQSLVRHSEHPRASRFAMLETIREFAGERLAGQSDLQETERRHAEFFADFTEQWGPSVRGPEATTAVEVLASDHDNIRAGMDWAVRADQAKPGLRTATAMRMFWVERGRPSEGRAITERLLALPSASRRDAHRAGALSALGAIYYWITAYPFAAEAYAESAAIYREIGNARGVAGALKDAGYVELARRVPETAASLIKEAMETAPDRGGGRVAHGVGWLAR